MQETSKNLNFLVKTQLAVEKLRVSTQVRNIHLRKQKRSDLTTQKIEAELVKLERLIDKIVAERIEDHPAYPWFSKVKGIGGENIAKIIGLVRVKPDAEKKYAKNISSLWKFAGMHVVAGKAPRREAGKKLEYSSQLRSMCWRLGSSLVRAKGKFYEYYLKEKEKYQARYVNRGFKIVPSNELPKDKKGRKYEPEGAISEGHLDNMARRKMIKIFLAMLFIVWRRELGLSDSSPYSAEHLGHSHIYKPKDFVENSKDKTSSKERAMTDK